MIPPINFTPYISAQIDESSEEDDEVGDDFENLYKGEISKSGVPILPSKRARKIPEKIQVSQEDLAELKNENAEQKISEQISDEETEESSEDMSIEEIKEQEETSSETEEQ